MPRPRTPALVHALPPPNDAGDARASISADRYLRGLLLDGGLEPGDMVPIDAVARRLTMSRQPVRDAVNRLALEGLVDVLPQVGCRVTRPDAAAVADFFAVFAASEAVVAGMAATRRDDAEANTLRRRAVDIARRAALAGPPAGRDPAYRTLNREFHEALHELARSPAASRIAETFWDRSDFYIRAAFGSLYFSPRVRRAHRAIVDAVVAGDAAAAELATRAHLATVGHDVATRLLEAAAE